MRTSMDKILYQNCILRASAEVLLKIAINILVIPYLENRKQLNHLPIPARIQFKLMAKTQKAINKH